MKKCLGKINLILWFFLTLTISGCKEKEVQGSSLTGISLPSVEAPVYPDSYDYDSADTAVVTEVSSVNKTVSFYNFELGKSYTLNVDNTTRFADKYDTIMSLSQVKVGTIADVIFLKSSKHLVQLRTNDSAFEIEGISQFEINPTMGVFTVGSSDYKVTANTYIMKDGEQVSYKDLENAGSVNIRGFDDVIEIIEVATSMGTVKITGAGYFEGGYLEITSSDIVVVRNEMEIDVPEGEYELKISHNTDSGSVKVLVEGGKTTIADFSNIEVKEATTGKFTINVTPADATITIDGKIYASGREYKLPFGMYTVTVEMDGYDTQMRFVNVGAEPVTVSVDLNEIVAEEEENSTLVSGNDVNLSSVSENENISVSGN